MRRILVVADQTTAEDALLSMVTERAADAPCEVTMLVPATAMSDQERAFNHSEHIVIQVGETAHVALARHRLDKGLARLRSAGLSASGEVADPDPFKAVEQAMSAADFTEIIVSTLPRSRWLSKQLPDRLRKRFHVPVVHVAAPAGPARHSRRRRGVAPSQVAPYHASHR